MLAPALGTVWGLGALLEEHTAPPVLARRARLRAPAARSSHTGDGAAAWEEARRAAREQGLLHAPSSGQLRRASVAPPGGRRGCRKHRDVMAATEGAEEVTVPLSSDTSTDTSTFVGLTAASVLDAYIARSS